MLEKSENKSLVGQMEEFAEHFAQRAFVSPGAYIYKSLDDLACGSLPDLKIAGPKTAETTAAKLGETAGTAALAVGTMLIATGAWRRAGLAGTRGLESTALSELGATSGSEIGIAGDRWHRSLRHGLALDASGITASLESKSIADFAKRPMPRFDLMKSTPVELPMSANALKQSQSYVETGLIAARVEDGLRLPVITDSHGFNKAGAAVDTAEKFIVVDRANDPVLKAVIDDAKSRFAGQALTPQLAMDLRGYVSSVFNRHQLPGETIATIYEETLRRNSANELPLGLFICKGTAPCLPRTALFKTLSDEIGLPARLREGFVGIKKPQPHVWTEVDFSNKFQVYDAMHPPNPLYRYVSVKH